MRISLLAFPLALAACAAPTSTVETPDRAIRSFNGASVVIQSKTATPDAADNALAATACADARFATTNFSMKGLDANDPDGIVSEYLYLCG